MISSKNSLAAVAEGWYETNLIWKEKHPSLTNNKTGSLERFNNLLHNFSYNIKFEIYSDIIRKQQKEETVETVDINSNCQNK